MQTGRVLNASRAFAELLNLTQEDRFYTCLPMYHGEPARTANTFALCS
jgi:hypothetical protein